MELKDKKCVPCATYVPPLPGEEKARLLATLGEGWELARGATRLARPFKFNNFRRALQFANEVGRIAEEEKHHPELHLGWGHCDVEIWTHTNDDLVENDFILAAKVTEAYARMVPPPVAGAL
jgi:4a-hydroxytetrahydrobiopterin dehydratase